MSADHYPSQGAGTDQGGVSASAGDSAAAGKGAAVPHHGDGVRHRNPNFGAAIYHRPGGEDQAGRGGMQGEAPDDFDSQEAMRPTFKMGEKTPRYWRGGLSNQGRPSGGSL